MFLIWLLYLIPWSYWEQGSQCYNIFFSFDTKNVYDDIFLLGSFDMDIKYLNIIFLFLSGDETLSVCNLRKETVWFLTVLLHSCGICYRPLGHCLTLASMKSQFCLFIFMFTESPSSIWVFRRGAHLCCSREGSILSIFLVLNSYCCIMVMYFFNYLSLVDEQLWSRKK